MLAALSFGCVAQSFAGQAEADLLRSHAGTFTGQGQLIGETRADVTCNLTVEASSSQKLRYSGRCVLGGERVPLSGSISYSDANQRYEASARGLGTVAGSVRGNGVTFTMGRSYRQNGQRGTFAVTFVLSGGSISLEFNVADQANGAFRATVPLSRS